ncbi:MAG: serine hydrolase domain-containing protein, partial [Bacteroidales bacterium]
MKKLSILITAIIFITAGVSGQAVSKADLKKLDEYYAKMVQDWDVPSASIGIVKDGEMIFSGNYGVLEEDKDAGPDKNTLYAIASNSKAFTSALIGMLVQEGKLDWNDKVRKYLPYFELYDPWVSNEVTIRDLLCHRVGLGTFSGDVIWYKADLTAEEIIQRVKYLPPAFDFRAGYGYSNVMYVAAGEVIRKVTGKSWSENVQERILEPLGMDRTITSPSELEARGNFATPYAREDETNIPIVWEDWETVGAMGGIISSIEDISKWMIFNLDNGIWGDDTLLTKETRNMVWTPHNNRRVDHTTKNDFNRHFSGYGLGWGLSDYHGRLRVGHTGAYDGMITAVTLIPDENLGVVVLTNGMKSPIMAASYYAIDKFLGLETRDWSAEYLERVNKRQ